MTLVSLLFPFAPHLASEIWEELKGEPQNLSRAKFPSYRPELLKESVLEVVVQVNGKLRSKVTVAASEAADEKKVVALAEASLKEKGLTVDSGKYKFVPGRLVNFVMSQVEVK